MSSVAPLSTQIHCLGPANRPSPLEVPSEDVFVDDQLRLLVDPHVRRDNGSAAAENMPGFEVAGPRRQVYFEPRHTRAAIATCGGLSPGVNAVVRSLVLQLWHRYGVHQIFGARNGLRGLAAGTKLMPLDLSSVAGIHEMGGTILGTSRGAPAVSEIVDSLERHRIDLFFPIGGDGTMRGALAMAEEAERRGLELSIVGVPKTIDNDIPWVRRSFGFETAVKEASEAVRAAHTEAMSVINGIGLVKLMGRHSGYIAANATLATGHVNYCLVPEVPFAVHGPGGLLDLLERRLERRGHALIVVAEGAGQEHLPPSSLEDESGNRRLGDIGRYLRDEITEHLRSRGVHFHLKYIDPGYMVRAAAPNPSDLLHCSRLAQNAVHAAMAGKTAMLVGYWHGQMTHVPLSALSGRSRTINPDGELWWTVLESTGQPLRIG